MGGPTDSVLKLRFKGCGPIRTLAWNSYTKNSMEIGSTCGLVRGACGHVPLALHGAARARSGHSKMAWNWAGFQTEYHVVEPHYRVIGQAFLLFSVKHLARADYALRYASIGFSIITWPEHKA